MLRTPYGPIWGNQHGKGIIPPIQYPSGGGTFYSKLAQGSKDVEVIFPTRGQLMVLLLMGQLMVVLVLLLQNGPKT